MILFLSADEYDSYLSDLFTYEYFTRVMNKQDLKNNHGLGRQILTLSQALLFEPYIRGPFVVECSSIQTIEGEDHFTELIIDGDHIDEDVLAFSREYFGSRGYLVGQHLSVQSRFKKCLVEECGAEEVLQNIPCLRLACHWGSIKKHEGALEIFKDFAKQLDFYANIVRLRSL